MGSFSSETRDSTEQNVPAGTEVVSLLLAAAGEATTLLLPEESDERWEKKRKRERVVWSLVSDLRETRRQMWLQWKRVLTQLTSQNSLD